MVVPIRLDEETKPSAPVKQPQPLERRGSATFKSNKRLTEAWARAAAPKVERRAGGGAGLGSSKSVPALGAANKPRTTLSGGASAVAARQSLAQLLDGIRRVQPGVPHIFRLGGRMLAASCFDGRPRFRGEVAAAGVTHWNATR